MREEVTGWRIACALESRSMDAFLETGTGVSNAKHHLTFQQHGSRLIVKPCMCMRHSWSFQRMQERLGMNDRKGKR